MNKWLYRISIALALLGLAVSIYMTDIQADRQCEDVHSAMEAVQKLIQASMQKCTEFLWHVFGVGGYAVIAALLFMENRISF